MKKVNVLSLFGWIECGRVAMERLGWNIWQYFSSEIDQYAIKITTKNYPEIIHVGSVTGLRYEDGALFHNQDNDPLKNWGSYIADIDIIIGWSPCQDLSIAKKDGKGLAGEKSWLFFEYVRLLKEINPKYFLLENVASMKKADRDEITRILTEVYPDVQCYLINSALVSAQNRRRLYWTNIQWVEQPEDKGILLKDILEESVDDKYIMSEDRTNFIRNRPKNYLFPIDPDKSNTIRTNYGNSSANESYISIRVWQFNNWWQWDRVYSPEWKYVSLSANGGWRWAKTGLYAVNPDWDKSRTIKAQYYKNWMANFNRKDWLWATWVSDNSVIRKLTPMECERLQTLPDNYTEGVSNTQRYKMIWNGWTVDVISHILSFCQF